MRLYKRFWRNAWSSDWEIACISGNVAYIHGKGFPLDQVVALTVIAEIKMNQVNQGQHYDGVMLCHINDAYRTQLMSNNMKKCMLLGCTNNQTYLPLHSKSQYSNLEQICARLDLMSLICS